MVSNEDGYDAPACDENPRYLALAEVVVVKAKEDSFDSKLARLKQKVKGVADTS